MHIHGYKYMYECSRHDPYHVFHHFLYGTDLLTCQRCARLRAPSGSSSGSRAEAEATTEATERAEAAAVKIQSRVRGRQARHGGCPRGALGMVL